MQELNFPAYQCKIKNNENKQFIFGLIRKKYILNTPEEWVRQHTLNYLMTIKKYPASLIAVEKQFKVNNLKKRSDILVFNTKGLPEIVVECKSPKVKITQDTFDQIARYNSQLQANYLLVTNGLEHFTCTMDHENGLYNFLPEIPNYK